MRSFPLAKCDTRLLPAVLTRRLLRVLQQASFFIDVSEVLEPLMRHDLVHEVNTSGKVQALLDLLNFNAAVFLAEKLLHIFLISLRGSRTKLTLDDKTKRVWHLGLASAYSSHQTGPMDAE